MKKIFLLVSLLVLAAACAPQPSGNSNMSSNANTGGAMKSTAAPSEADIEAKEKAGWDAFKRRDAEAFKKLLVPEFIGIIDTGTEDTAQSIASMKDNEITDITFADWKMTTIDKDAVLITYTTNVKGTYKGKPIPPGPYYEASAYVNRNGEWLGIYYQETMQQKMAAPTASPSPAKTASPMGKPAETTADVAANEKLVWDALKSRNYDAFAGYLADNSIEIEADGIYDKAGSVKNVQGFDASKAELSNWKTVKFDDDASLVTYTVKILAPKPATEYHSTIWINRDSKWRAFFHMGTPAGSASPAAGSPTPATGKSPMKKM